MRSDHHWITLHRVQFQDSVSAKQTKFDIPSTPECWRFCPGQQLDKEGVPGLSSDIWCGLGIFSDRSEAEEMVAAPEIHLPFMSEAIQQWHALAIPTKHRGEVNWRGHVEKNSAIRVAPKDTNDPLAIITTAGFLSYEPDQIPRIVSFAQGADDVLNFFDEQEGNLRSAVFSNGLDQREGITISLWRDEKAMVQAAYLDGRHRTLMDESRDGSIFDRSSFTRARILSSNGSWNGDPFQ